MARLRPTTTSSSVCQGCEGAPPASRSGQGCHRTGRPLSGSWCTAVAGTEHLGPRKTTVRVRLRLSPGRVRGCCFGPDYVRVCRASRRARPRTLGPGPGTQTLSFRTKPPRCQQRGAPGLGPGEGLGPAKTCIGPRRLPYPSTESDKCSPGDLACRWVLLRLGSGSLRKVGPTLQQGPLGFFCRAAKDTSRLRLGPSGMPKTLVGLPAASGGSLC